MTDPYPHWRTDLDDRLERWLEARCGAVPKLNECSMSMAQALIKANIRYQKSVLIRCWAADFALMNRSVPLPSQQMTKSYADFALVNRSVPLPSQQMTVWRLQLHRVIRNWKDQP